LRQLLVREMIDNGEDLQELIDMGLGEYIQDYFEE
jgi:hypothetical protein